MVLSSSSSEASLPIECVSCEPSMALLSLKIEGKDKYFRVETDADGRVLVVCVGGVSDDWKNVGVVGIQRGQVGGEFRFSEDVDEALRPKSPKPSEPSGLKPAGIANLPVNRGSAVSFSDYEWRYVLAGLPDLHPQMGEAVPMEQAVVSGERVTFRAFFNRFFGEA
jgi:hypothetical protein